VDSIKVLAVVENEELRFDIKSRLTHEDIAFVGFSKSGAMALDKVLSLMPNVVLIVFEKNENASLEVAEKIYVSLPGCVVIMLCESIDILVVEKAMHAGVRKVLSFNCDQKTLIESIKLGFNMEKSRVLNSNSKVVSWQSRVITVFGSKGGIGKTMLASNLAVALARTGKKVAVLDLDLQFGDVNLFFDLDPKDTIAELVQERQNFDIDIIKSFMMLHSSSVSVMCAPKSPELAEIIEGEHIEKIINTIRPYYDYIIIDTPPMFNETTIVAIENSNLVLLVITLDISTLRNAKISLDVFESLQQKDKISILVNRDAPSIISVKDAQNILDVSIKYKVSSDWKTAITSLNKGVPLIIDAPRTVIGRELINLGNVIVSSMNEKN